MKETKCHVLYVDDNEDTRHLIELLLTRSGYDVKTACCAEEALSLAGREQFEIYILDYRLPDMDGVELLRRLRQLTPATPIVFYSAAAMADERRRAMEAGADGYITKPAELDQFLASISRTIEEAQREGRLETKCAA